MMNDYSNQQHGNGQQQQHGPTIIIDRQLSLHRMARYNNNNGSATTVSSDDLASQNEDPNIGMSLSRTNLMEATTAVDESSPMLMSAAPPVIYARNYSSSFGSKSSLRLGGPFPMKSIRFQVVIWYIGPVDVVLGRVPMKFRITIFWNDTDEDEYKANDQEDSMSSTVMWKMQGRRRASQVELNDAAGVIAKTVNVPPVSILNAVSFHIIDHPEVNLLREDTKLMRWSCLYDAILLQDNIKVDTFPHDAHELVLKIGILSHRQRGDVWDKSKWKLGLATEHDSKGTTRIPHGLIVDDVKIPEFHHKVDGLKFEFPSTSFGVESTSERDKCLKLSLHVERNSGYYDQNIMPLLAALNIVGLAIIYALEATDFFQRGLLLLNIAFTQMGIRMTVDSHLPNVGYQIKMQRILNQFFFILLIEVLESSIVYVLNERKGWSLEACHLIDVAVLLVALTHSVFTVVSYYRSVPSPGK